MRPTLYRCMYSLNYINFIMFLNNATQMNFGNFNAVRDSGAEFRIHVDEQIKRLRFPGFIDVIEAKETYMESQGTRTF